MRFRIGYGGPKEYRHGRYFPGGRVNNGGMTEFERLVHLIASMQVLFGSRRGGLLVPVLLIGLAFGGWMLYRNYYSPESQLERAHAMYDSSSTKEQIEAIKQYKLLLAKSDPIEPARKWLLADRDTLYRRIIQHEFKFAEDEDAAYEWIDQAWQEGLVNLRFKDKAVREFWERSIASMKKNSSKDKNRIPVGASNSDSKYGDLPGID